MNNRICDGRKYDNNCVLDSKANPDLRYLKCVELCLRMERRSICCFAVTEGMTILRAPLSFPYSLK